MQLTGIIEKAYEGTTSGGKVKTDYTVNGQRFTAWAAKQANIGDNVTIEYTEKQNGQYTNRTVKSLSVAGGAAPAPQTASAAPTAAPRATVSNDARQAMIVDQNSNTNATQLLVKMIEKEMCKTHEMNIDELLTMHGQIATNLSQKVMEGAYHQEVKDDDFADSDIPF